MPGLGSLPCSHTQQPQAEQAKDKGYILRPCLVVTATCSSLPPAHCVLVWILAEEVTSYRISSNFLVSWEGGAICTETRLFGYQSHNKVNFFFKQQLVYSDCCLWSSGKGAHGPLMGCVLVRPEENRVCHSGPFAQKRRHGLPC